MSVRRAASSVGLAMIVGMVITGCSGDDDDSTDTASTPTTSAADTGADTTSGPTPTSETDPSAGSSTGSAADCSDATDADACSSAANLAEGGGCTWMAIHDLAIDDAGVCEFTDSGTGACVGTIGLDDGCNGPSGCEGTIEAYFRADGDGWQMAAGTACRGISGFMTCEDDTAAPCTCACDIPDA